MKSNNIYLIVIGILAVIIAILLFMQYSKPSLVSDMIYDQDSETDTGTNQNTNGWKKSEKFGLWYPSNARITESYYLSPVEQGNGSLPYMGIPYAEFLDFPNSDMTIIWGGAQSGCGDGDYDFQYGVSEITCVKGMKAYMGTQDVRKGITASDKKIFGDFVIKNK